MTLVLTTSSGVVRPAATDPARLPNNALGAAPTPVDPDPGTVRASFPALLRDAYASFIDSHIVNCKTVNGISRAIVMDVPRYNSLITSPKPLLRRSLALPDPACRKERISLSASNVDPPNNPAWARCLITSVGTRTAHADISPRDEARECVKIACCHDTGVEAEDDDGGGRR